MRILFVHDRMGEFSGAEVNIRLTAQELARRGHWLGLCHGPGTGRDEEQWRRLFSGCFELVGTDGATRTPQLIAACRPDLIYLHRPPDLATMEALLDSRIPVVRMVHDHDLYCLRGYKYNYFTRHICTRATSPFCVFPCGAVLGRNYAGGRWPVRWHSYRQKQRELALNRRCEAVVVYSAYARAEMVRNGFAAGKILLHSPVQLMNPLGLTASFSERNRLVYTGQLVRGKGVDVLLDALSRVKTPFECLIFGDGRQRAACERRVQWLGLGARVQFRGCVGADEIAAAYRDASLAVMSSVWPEPFGMAGPEAMRHGLPVVAFDAGGIKEWLHDGVNGCLVPWMDRSAFAARVDQLLTDKPLARQLGEQGRHLVRQFDAARQVARLEELFHQVVADAKELLCA